jgi:hypothetical protein
MRDLRAVIERPVFIVAPPRSRDGNRLTAGDLEARAVELRGRLKGGLSDGEGNRPAG